MYVIQCARCGARHVSIPHDVAVCPGCGLKLIMPSGIPGATTGWNNLRLRLRALYIFLRFEIFKCRGNVEYEIKRLLGKSAGAEVYFARDTAGKAVVVKIFSDYRYFTPEAPPDDDAVKTLDIFAIARSPGSWRRAIVTEYMQGGSLAERMRRQSFASSLQAICEVIVPLCLFINRIHASGRVHGRLTPANIFFDSQNNIKLGDFQWTGVAGREDISLYSAAYLSPEQCRGEEVTLAADIYALGCIFFELLTGRKVFERSSVDEYRACHVNFPAPRPDIVNDELPIAISELLLDTLSKKPEDRCANVEVILRALLPELIAGAKAKEKSRRSALEALAKIGIVAAPALISVIEEQNWDISSPVFEALKEIGPEAIPALISTLRCEEKRSRHVAKILEMICPDPESAISALANALQNKNRDTRLAAAQILADAGPNAAPVVFELGKALEDEDVFVRFAAAEALGKVGEKAQSELSRLIRALDDPIAFVSFAAAEALGKIGTVAKDALPALARVSKSRDLFVRFNAVKAIDRIKPKEASLFSKRRGGLAGYWAEKTMEVIAPKTRETQLAVQSASRENEWNIGYYAAETMRLWLSRSCVSDIPLDQ